jgi:hypothetical protein
MTRLETFVAAIAATVLLAVHAPAAAQTVVGDGPEAPKAQVTIKGKPAKSSKPPKPPEEPTFRIQGGLETTKERARESAIRAAAEEIHQRLMQEEPPVFKNPPMDLVRRMILEGQDRVTEQQFQLTADSEKTDTMYQVEVAVKVRPEHVRELRSRERASDGLWVLAGFGGLAAVLALFFKIDAWTKGYLTSWLVLGTVGAASLVGGLWWMAK